MEPNKSLHWTGTLLSAGYQGRDSDSTYIEVEAHFVEAPCVCLPERHGPTWSVPALTQGTKSRYLVGAHKWKLAGDVQI